MAGKFGLVDSTSGDNTAPAPAAPFLVHGVTQTASHFLLNPHAFISQEAIQSSWHRRPRQSIWRSKVLQATSLSFGSAPLFSLFILVNESIS